MKKIFLLIIALIVGEQLFAQQLSPYERTRQNQVLSDRATKSTKYLGIPSGPSAGFPAYVPDSLKVGSLFNVTGGAAPGLYVYGASGWGPVAPPATGGGAASAGNADYAISKIGATITATPRTGSGMTVIKGTDAYTVIQGSINALAAINGGHIYIQSGSYTLTNELTITGHAVSQPPTDQIVITGDGFSTVINQPTAGKNVFVARNRAAFVLRDMFFSAAANAKSCILLADDGTVSVSAFGAIIDNVFCQAASATSPAAIFRNTFDVHCPTLYCYNPNNDGLVIESTSTQTIFGNSAFGFLRTYASPNFAGLRVKGYNTYKSVDMLSFSNYECISAKYGIYLNGCNTATFNLVDIEYLQFPIWIDGDPTHQNVGNRFLGGYIYPEGANACGITVNNASSGGNTFNLYVQVDDPNMQLITDKQSYGGANSYDLTLSYGADPAKILITDPENTILILRSLLNGVTYSIPSPPLAAVDNKPATTWWVHYQNFLKKSQADTTYANPKGYNATGKWPIDIYGSAGYWHGVRGALDTIATANPQLMVGMEPGTYAAKSYTNTQVQNFLGLKLSAFYDYAPAPLNMPYFTDPASNTQAPGDNTAKLANTAFVQAAVTFVYNSLTATSAAYTIGQQDEFITFEAYAAQAITVQGTGRNGMQKIFKNTNPSNNITITFPSTIYVNNVASKVITLTPGQGIWLIYAYLNHFTQISKWTDN